MKQMINVTDITGYLYCPRKMYLKLIKKIREPPTKPMILGFLKHKVFDIFSKNESLIISEIRENLEKEQIEQLYKTNLIKITNQIIQTYSNMINNFKIEKQELQESILNFMEKEIKLRIESIKKTIELGYFGKELWRNLKPKYLTEFQIISEELGLKGRIDRIKLDKNIIPYEIKTRDDIYESDKIQLAAYSLLLEEEFDKEIKTAVIETKNKQEEIQITQELKNKVIEIAEKLRNLKEPEFLNNFNKCKSCRIKKQCFE